MIEDWFQQNLVKNAHLDTCLWRDSEDGSFMDDDLNTGSDTSHLVAGPTLVHPLITWVDVLDCDPTVVQQPVIRNFRH